MNLWATGLLLATTLLPCLAVANTAYKTLTYKNLTYKTLPEPIVQALDHAHISPHHISISIRALGTADSSRLNAHLITPNNDNGNLHNFERIDNVTHVDNINHANSIDGFAHIQHLNQQPRIPASTLKLIPTYIALHELGADFTWMTRVYHTGLVIADRLYGDLIIQGSGDPKLTIERLQWLLTQVQARGIRHIEGDIILDSSIFRQVGKNPASFDNDPLRPYNTSADGFLLNFNSVEIHSHPQADGTARLYYRPVLADYAMPSVIAQRLASCHSLRDSLDPVWQHNQLSFNRDLPTGCTGQLLYIAHPDPKRFAAAVVKGEWQRLGNTLSGQVISQEQPYSFTDHLSHQPRQQWQTLAPTPIAIASLPSLPLAKQIYDINHYSNNVMTEQLMLSLPVYTAPVYTANSAHADTSTANHANNVSNANNANHANHVSNASNASNVSSRFHGQGDYAPVTAPQSQHNHSSYPRGLNHVQDWWHSHLNTPTPVMSNGSGLCRDCTLSTDNLSELLGFAYEQPEFDTFVTSLGLAGVDGSIATHSNRLPNSAAIRRAWIKTGTLSDVVAIAGYVHGVSGQDYSVVAIINDEDDIYAARKVLDAVLDWTARY